MDNVVNLKDIRVALYMIHARSSNSIQDIYILYLHVPGTPSLASISLHQASLFLRHLLFYALLAS